MRLFSRRRSHLVVQAHRAVELLPHLAARGLAVIRVVPDQPDPGYLTLLIRGPRRR